MDLANPKEPLTMANKNRKPTEDEALQPQRNGLEIIRTDTVISRLPAHNLFGQGGVSIQLNKKDAAGQTKLSWTVSFNPGVGEAGQLAYRIETLIINRRIDEAGRPAPAMIRLGSLSDICHELGINPSGANTNSVKRALQQNAGALITANLAYKGTDGSKQKLEATFTKYSLAFRGDELPNGEKSDGVIILLNEQYRRVLNRAGTRPLDFLYLKDLTPSAQRFYEIISYQIYAALKYGYPEAKLLYSDYCAYSGQPRQASAVEMNKRMYKIHQPHIKSGYITNVAYQATRDSDGAPDWVMAYVPGPRAVAEFERFNRKLYTEDHSIDLDLDEGGQGREVTPAAVRLVQHFHLLARGTKNYRPRPKGAEIKQAEEVVRRLGTEGAWFFIEYAIAEAKKTQFKMAQFGGAMQYLDAAEAAWKRQAENRQDSMQREMEELARQKEDEELLRQAEERIQSLPRETFDALYAKARKETIKKAPAAASWDEETMRGPVMAIIRRQIIEEILQAETRAEKTGT
jgi:hypothetical protein